MIRVMVVDDHPIVRAGIVGLLDTEPDFEVVAEASSGEEALELVGEAQPDVVLMDLRMPGMGGVEATRWIAEHRGPAPGPRSSDGGGSADGPAASDGDGSAGGRGCAAGRPVRVLVFTTYEDDDQILAAIEAGAGGYLVKAAPAEELAAGVRAVAAGQTVLAPSVASALALAARGTARERDGGEPDEGGVSEAACSGGDASPRLTAREAEILALVAEGLSNPAIAQRLFIGESTVKTHLLHVFEKLGVSDRTRAVIRAMELGMI